MKKIFRIIPPIFVIMALLWGGIVDFIPKPVHAMAGNGSEQNPYIITSPVDLQAVNDDLDAWYELGADIDLAGVNFIGIGFWYEVPIDP
jgi:hypothetical protein